MLFIDKVGVLSMKKQGVLTGILGYDKIIFKERKIIIMTRRNL